MSSKLLFSLLLLCPIVGLGHNLKYQFSYIPSPTDPQNLCLNVLMESQTDDAGHIDVYLPGGILNFILNGEKNIKATVDWSTRIIKVNQTPNKPVLVSAVSCYPNPHQNVQYGIYQPELFYIQPIFLCPYPIESDRKYTWDVTLDFTKMPSNMNFISSMGAENKLFSGKSNLTKFMNDIFLGSILPINKFQVNNQTVHYIMNGKPDFLKEDFISKLQLLLKHQRNFFHDNDFDHYNMYLQLDHNNDKPKNFSGRHFNNMLTIAVNLDEENLPYTMIMASHELFHAWVPIKIPFEITSNEHMWFNEGITDYYGARFALETELVTKLEYQDKINDMLVRYFASPLHKVSNQEALKFYFEMNHINILTARGHIIALILSQLKSNEGNQNILDDIMLELFKSHKDNSSPKSQLEVFNALFAKHLGGKLWADIQKNIYTQTKSPDLFKALNLKKYNKKKNKPTFKLVNKKMGVTAYQFDFEAFIKQRIIKDLVIDSPEYKAGLRESMQVINDTIVMNAEKKKRMIIVRTKEGSQKIEFVPDFRVMRIPQIYCP